MQWVACGLGMWSKCLGICKLRFCAACTWLLSWLQCTLLTPPATPPPPQTCPMQTQDCEAVAHPRPDQIDLIVSKYQRLARSASLQRKSEKEGGGEGRLLETEAALGDVRGAAVNPRRQASQADERVGPAQPTPVLESTFSELSLSRILVVHNVEEWRVAAKVHYTRASEYDFTLENDFLQKGI